MFRQQAATPERVPRRVRLQTFLQSEKSKRAGNTPSSTLVVEFLRSEYKGTLEVLLLEEDMNFNARATSFSVSGSLSSILCLNS